MAGYPVQLGYLVGSLEIDVVGGWRYMYGFGAPIAIVMGIGMVILPPSPRWLLLRAVQGKGLINELKENAILALRKLRRRPADDSLSETQINDAMRTLESSYAKEEPGGSFMEVFEGANLKAFIIGGGLVLFQQVV